MAWLDDHPNRTLSQQRSPRRQALSGVIVVHTAENTPDFVAFDGGAEAVANFIRTRDTYGSYHWLADSDSHIHMVEWSNEAFHDATSRGNQHEVGISAATRADVWPLASKEWRDGCIDNLAIGAANAARYIKHVRGIVVEPRLLTRDQSEARVPGFISHARRDPSRRTDPGDKFPWEQFFARYRHHAADVLGGSQTPNPEGPEMNAEERKMLEDANENARNALIVATRAVQILEGKGYDPKEPGKNVPAKGTLPARLLNAAYRMEQNDAADAARDDELKDLVEALDAPEPAG